MANDLLPDGEDLVVLGEDAVDHVADGLLQRELPQMNTLSCRQSSSHELKIQGLELKELTSQKATGDNSYMQNTYEVVFTKFVET